MTEQEANERMALLLGWERLPYQEGGHLRSRWRNPVEGIPDDCPDFSQWHHFPELQEYAKDLDSLQLALEASQRVPYWSQSNMLLSLEITPAILRDAILAVVGEEAEVTG